MEKVRVIIDNWQRNPWYHEWIPIMVAIIALITSVISLYWTRKEFIKNTRPFVWASNYGVIDNEKKTIIPIPFRVAFRVKNSPARIIDFKVKIFLGKNQLFEYIGTDLVRFPDESSEWNFGIGKNDFEAIINRPAEDKIKLVRLVEIKYSSLDGGKDYHFKLEQKFIIEENQWQDISETAD